MEFNNPLAQAQLLIGSSQTLAQKTVSFLQQFLASCGGCAACTTCLSIATKQHNSLLWITPEKRYKVEDLEPVLHATSFMLTHDQKFFCVLEHADQMPPACANRLLKLIEEPSPGYHFILLAQRKEAVLETIRSRCHIVALQGSDTQATPRWHAYFTTNLNGDPLTFLQELDTQEDLERVEHLDALLAFWQKQHTNALAAGDASGKKKSSQLLSIITDAYKHLPMPGSGKIFWKNILLMMRGAQS